MACGVWAAGRGGYVCGGHVGATTVVQATPTLTLHCTPINHKPTLLLASQRTAAGSASTPAPLHLHGDDERVAAGVARVRLGVLLPCIRDTARLAEAVAHTHGAGGQAGRQAQARASKRPNHATMLSTIAATLRQPGPPAPPALATHRCRTGSCRRRPCRSRPWPPPSPQSQSGSGP